MFDALDSVGLDCGFLVAGKIDVGKYQQSLRAIGEIKSAVEVHRLDAALLAAGLIEGVREGYRLIVDLVGQMRGEQGDRQGNGRLDVDAEFLAVVVGSHQTVDLGCRGELVLFVEDAPPVELGLNAVVVLDVEIVGGDELPHSGSEDRANGREDGLFGPALIVEGDDHGPFGGKMALVNRAGDMFLHAEETEMCGRVGVLHGSVPFVGPSHGHGHRISGVDLHMHVATSGRGTIDAAGMKAGGLKRDGLGVGSNPGGGSLRTRTCGEGAEQ